VSFFSIFFLGTGVHRRGVIPPPNCFPMSGKEQRVISCSQEHRHLAAASRPLVLPVGTQLGDLHAVMLRDRFLDLVGGNLPPAGAENGGEDRFARSRLISLRCSEAWAPDPDETPFKLADVVFHHGRQIQRHVLGQSDVFRFRLPLRIASRVSMSGAWMSATRPHSKRDWIRSSRSGISLGNLSLETRPAGGRSTVH